MENMSTLDTVRTTYADAAVAFLDLVAEVPLERYAGPGLGNWDLRALIGHTGRSFGTVSTYLATRADRVTCEDAADYFAVVSRLAHGSTRDAIHQRGIEAGWRSATTRWPRCAAPTRRPSSPWSCSTRRTP